MDSDMRPETISVRPYSPEMLDPAHSGSKPAAPDAWNVKYRPPTSLSGALWLLLDYTMTASLLVPSVCGVLLGWWASDSLNVQGALLSVASFFCLIISLNILSEYNDYRYRLRPESKYHDDDSYFAGMNLISANIFNVGFVLSVGALFFIGGLLLTLLLTSTITGWPSIFFFAIVGILLALYLLPPRWHGYLGWGLGELGIAAIGVVQVVSNYYVQMQMVDSLALLFGIPLGLFAVLVLFSRNLIRMRIDWMIRKRTWAVVLGQQYSIYFFITTIVLAYASLLLVVILTSLPLLLMLGMLTLPMAIGPFKNAEDMLETPDARHYLHRIMIKVMLLTGTLLGAILVVDKIIL